MATVDSFSKNCRSLCAPMLLLRHRAGSLRHVRFARVFSTTSTVLQLRPTYPTFRQTAYEIEANLETNSSQGILIFSVS